MKNFILLVYKVFLLLQEIDTQGLLEQLFLPEPDKWLPSVRWVCYRVLCFTTSCTICLSYKYFLVVIFALRPGARDALTDLI